MITVRRSSRPSRAQRRMIARRMSRPAIKPARPMEKNEASQSRETASPSLRKKEMPMNSRKTKDHDETIRVICRNWPRKTCTSYISAAWKQTTAAAAMARIAAI